jgi:hypothetical protein
MLQLVQASEARSLQKRSNFRSYHAPQKTSAGPSSLLPSWRIQALVNESKSLTKVGNPLPDLRPPDPVAQNVPEELPTMSPLRHGGENAARGGYNF